LFPDKNSDFETTARNVSRGGIPGQRVKLVIEREEEEREEGNNKL
jgi:hypothetical protein